MFALQDKVALITGGISGIGLLIVKEFMTKGLKGITIVDCNRNEMVLEELNGEFGDKILFVKADVGNQNQFKDAFEKTIEKFGNIDILINNAGVFNDRHWEKCIDTNFKGTVNGNLLALQYIKKYRSTEEGVVINVASVVGLAPHPSVPMYSATKHAIVGLSSLGLDVHYNNTKIKIITICPGLTDTTFLTENMENKILSAEYLNIIQTTMEETFSQPPIHVAKELSLLIKDALSGSVWVIENNEPAYEIEIPIYTKMRKLPKNVS